MEGSLGGSANLGADANNAPATNEPMLIMSPPPVDPAFSAGSPPNPALDQTAQPSVAPVTPSRVRSSGVDAEVQTDRKVDRVHSLLRGGVLKFPLFCAVLCPTALLISGVSYLATWRVGSLQSPKPSSEARPPALYAFVFFIFWGLVCTYALTIPRFVAAAIDQSSSEDRRKAAERRAVLMQVVLVNVPLVICELVLVGKNRELGRDVDEDGKTRTAVLTLPVFSAGGNMLIIVMLLWWIYVNAAVDYIRTRVERVANRYARKHGLNNMRRGGVRIPFRFAVPRHRAWRRSASAYDKEYAVDSVQMDEYSTFGIQNHGGERATYDPHGRQENLYPGGAGSDTASFPATTAAIQEDEFVTLASQRP